MDSKFLRTTAQWLRARFARNLLRVTAVIGLLVIPSHKIYNVDNNIYDLLVKFRFMRATQLRYTADPEMVFILIDDEARRLDEHRWLVRTEPTSRLYLARIIERLAFLKAPPSVLGVDFRLDRPVSDPAEDEALSRAICQAIKSGIKVVLGTALTETDAIAHPLLPLDTFLQSGSVELGFTNFIHSSTDKVVRQAAISFPLISHRTAPWYVARGLDSQFRALTGVHSGGKPLHWSFAAALLMASKNEKERQGFVSQLCESPFWIDFPAPSHLLFRFYSSAQFLKEKDHDGELDDAVVILGASYDGSSDRVPTPISTSTAPWLGLWGINPIVSRELPGVIVHGYAVRTLKQLIRDQAPFHAGPWILVSIAVLIGSLQVFIGARLYKILAIPESVLVLPTLYAIVCVWLFESGHGYLPVARPVSAYLVVFAIVRQTLYRIGEPGNDEHENSN